MPIQLPEHELSFEYVRSSGPGGQNVNKVNSKAMLRWSIVDNRTLPSGVIARFVARYPSRINSEGVVVITSDRYRDQRRNAEDCRAKLLELLQSVETPPRPRRETKPTKGSVRRRLNDKRHASERKRSRKGDD